MLCTYATIFESCTHNKKNPKEIFEEGQQILLIAHCHIKGWMEIYFYASQHHNRFRNLHTFAF
jgi:hypothetical protein